MIQSNGWRIPYCADLHVCYSITVMSFKLNIAWKARWKTPDEHCPKLFSVTHFMIIWLLEDWFRYIRDIKQFTFLWLHVFFWKIGQCKEPTNFIAFLGLNIDSSVIRQKGESQNGGLKKTKYIKYSEKRTYLTTWYAHVRVGIMGYEMFIFRKIWCALFSWNTHFEIRPFALLPTTSSVFLKLLNIFVLSRHYYLCFQFIVWVAYIIGCLWTATWCGCFTKCSKRPMGM